MTVDENLGHEQRQIRLDKLKKMESNGIDAYPHSFKPNATSASLAQKYADLAPDTQTEDVVVVAGRVRAVRNSGMFMDIYDATGKVQIYTSKEHSETKVLEMLDMIDIGDVIGIKGTARRTKRGELSVSNY